MIIQDLYPGAQQSSAQMGGSAVAASGSISQSASGAVSAGGDGPIALVLAAMIVAALALMTSGRG